MQLSYFIFQGLPSASVRFRLSPKVLLGAAPVPALALAAVLDAPGRPDHRRPGAARAVAVPAPARPAHRSGRRGAEVAVDHRSALPRARRRRLFGALPPPARCAAAARRPLPVTARRRDRPAREMRFEHRVDTATAEAAVGEFRARSGPFGGGDRNLVIFNCKALLLQSSCCTSRMLFA